MTQTCRGTDTVLAKTIASERTNGRKTQEENHGPHRLQRSREIQRSHPRTARQEPQRQHLSYDGALAELFLAILPARRRDPYRGELDPVVRELAITRTGILCEAPYEIVAHKRIGKGVGVTDEQNAALENWQAATCFNEVQRAALAFADEVVKLRKPTDATFNAIKAKLTPGALVELQLSIGFYVMTSKFLETFAIDMQPVNEVVG